MTGGGVTRVPIPHNARKVIQEVKKTIGPKHSEEFVYTTLKDCDMDPKEAGRRLKMIQDIREIAGGKHSVEDVYTMLKDCNMDPNEAAQRLLYIDTFHEVKKKHDRRKSISSDTSEDYKRTQWRRNLSSGKECGVTNRQERVSRLIIPGKETNVANGNGTLAISNGSYSHKLAPELSADVSSSTSDTAVVSSKNTCAIGTIKCEIVNRSSSGKSNARLPADIKFSADQVIEEAEDSEDTRKLKSVAVEKIQISESLKPLSLSTCDSSQVVSPNQDNQPPQLLNEPLKEVMERISINNVNSNTHSIPEEKCKELKLPARKPDATLSSHQSVIFPDNLQVPEDFKNHFTFGSLDLDDSQLPPSCEQNDEIAPEPCLKDNNISSESDPAAALKHEQIEVEMRPPVQNPVVQRDYSFGFMPHLMGPHVDVPDLQSGRSVIASSGLGESETQGATAGAGENCMALSPPVFPYFRHEPFAIANYIPYNPYFPPPPHLYLPHLFNPNSALFPHQPPPSPQLKQDLTLSQQKDNNNLHLPLQQGEEMPNYFYNFPQGHQQHMHMPMPMPMGLQAGIYQQPFIIQQPQPMVPPHHAPQTLANRETS